MSIGAVVVRIKVVVDGKVVEVSIADVDCPVVEITIIDVSDAVVLVTIVFADAEPEVALNEDPVNGRTFLSILFSITYINFLGSKCLLNIFPLG